MKKEIQFYTPKDEINSLEDFYPYYLSQHSNNMNRLLHFIGTSLGLINFIISAIYLSLVNVLLGLICGYSFAWIGHFFFEKNKPATFKYPLMSFLCDFIMYWKILSGHITDDFKKYSIRNIKYIQTDMF